MALRLGGLVTSQWSPPSRESGPRLRRSAGGQTGWIEARAGPYRPTYAQKKKKEKERPAGKTGGTRLRVPTRSVPGPGVSRKARLARTSRRRSSEEVEVASSAATAA